MIIKKIKCLLHGHVIDYDKEPLIQSISGSCWVRKCERCNRYVIHSDIGTITISENEALEFKEEIENEMKKYDLYKKEK